MEQVYLARFECRGYAPIYKIGRSFDVPRRMRQLGLDLVDSAPASAYSSQIETKLHRRFIERGKHRAGEYFNLSDRDVLFIVRLFRIIRMRWDEFGRMCHL